jgi:hypothetical protein
LKIKAHSEQQSPVGKGYGDAKPGDPIGKKRHSFRSALVSAIRTIVLVLAILVFVVLGAYLHAIWLCQVPPTPAQIDRTAVEISQGAYHITAPNGAKYVVSASVGGEDDARKSARL